MRNIQEKWLKVLHFILKSYLKFLELGSVNVCIPNSWTVPYILFNYFFPCSLIPAHFLRSSAIWHFAHIFWCAKKKLPVECCKKKKSIHFSVLNFTCRIYRTDKIIVSTFSVESKKLTRSCRKVCKRRSKPWKKINKLMIQESVTRSRLLAASSSLSSAECSKTAKPADRIPAIAIYIYL